MQLEIMHQQHRVAIVDACEDKILKLESLKSRKYSAFILLKNQILQLYYRQIKFTLQTYNLLILKEKCCTINKVVKSGYCKEEQAMAKNPMQRKAQNSFLLGILVTLLITGLIIGFLVIQLTQLTKEKKQEQANSKTVYVLTQDVNSGETITEDKLKSQIIDASIVPSNALNAGDLSSKTDVIDETTGNLIKKYDVVSKINLKRGTIVTQDMIAVQGEITSDIRKMEYNVIQLTSQIQSGKYIDVRLRLANGKDLIVLSHKKIEIPTINGVESENTIWMNLDETEILTMSCAIVESYRLDGAYLYAAEYVEPGLQEAATETYLPSDEIINLIDKDPNCVLEAKNAIFQRYNDQNLKSTVRNSIINSLSSEDISDKVTEEVQKMQEERQKYLESLGN